jgi:hypothetical protein
MAQADARNSNLISHAGLAVLVLYCAFLFHGFLFSTEGSLCPDTFYHARRAYMLPEHGLARSFPWMGFTHFEDGYFDIHFLYNVALVPFVYAASEPLAGVKVATLLLQLALMVMLYVLLWKLKAPWPLLWVALLVAGSGLFLNRLQLARSHVMSMSLMLLALYMVMQQRFWPVFWAGFIYVWCYSAPQAVICTVLAAECCQILFKGWPRPFPKMTLAITAGLLAGHVIHPYTPLMIASLWRTMVIAFSAAGADTRAEQGSEYVPLAAMNLHSLWIALGTIPGTVIALLAAVGGALALRFKLLKGRVLSTESAMALGPALGWFIGMFIFKRVVEYAHPMAMLAAALVARDLLGTREELRFSSLSESGRNKSLSFLGVAAVLLVLSHAWSTTLMNAAIAATRGEYFSDAAWQRGRHFEDAATWMDKNIPPKARVLSFNFDDVPELYYSSPSHYYCGGMDPNYLRMRNPDKAELIASMRVRLNPDGTQTAREPLDFARLAAAFDTEYMILRTYRALKYPQLRAGFEHPDQPDVIKPVYKDPGAVIYKLR